MEKVYVIFEGMILWWMAGTPQRAIVPDLRTYTVEHRATISAPPSAFAGGACPPGFPLADGACTFALNGAGSAGGVQIELVSPVPNALKDLPPESMCLVPKLQQPPNDPLVLAPAYTPPDGARNAAWMNMSGGRAESLMRQCNGAPNCPRLMQWTVPSAPTLNVVLVLKNLSSGRPDMTVALNNGATVTIANVPPSEILLRRAKRRNRMRRSAFMNAAEDWCAYFTMLGTQSNPNQPPTCRQPLVPVCDATPPTHASAAPHGHAGPNVIETIACSNSQYP